MWPVNIAITNAPALSSIQIKYKLFLYIRKLVKVLIYEIIMLVKRSAQSEKSHTKRKRKNNRKTREQSRIMIRPGDVASRRYYKKNRKESHKYLKKINPKVWDKNYTNKLLISAKRRY